MNAHIYPPDCVSIQPLPEAQCGCVNNPNSCNPAPPELPNIIAIAVFSDVVVIVIPGYLIIVSPPQVFTVVSSILPPAPNPYPSPTVDVIRRLLLSNPIPLQVYITGGTYRCLTDLTRFVIIYL